MICKKQYSIKPTSDSRSITVWTESVQGQVWSFKIPRASPPTLPLLSTWPQCDVCSYVIWRTQADETQRFPPFPSPDCLTNPLTSFTYLLQLPACLSVSPDPPINHWNHPTASVVWICCHSPASLWHNQTQFLVMKRGIFLFHNFMRCMKFTSSNTFSAPCLWSQLPGSVI